MQNNCSLSLYIPPPTYTTTRGGEVATTPVNTEVKGENRGGYTFGYTNIDWRE